MLSRYPHTGFIKQLVGDQDEDGDFTGTEAKYVVKGRYEPNSQSKSLDYVAKFYCSRLFFPAFNVDNSTFEFNGREFKITQMHEYQTHTELWLT